MNQKEVTKRCITPQQLQEIYGIPVGTSANNRYLGKGCKYQKVGRRILYFIEDVEAWIRENQFLTIDSIPDEKKWGR